MVNFYIRSYRNQEEELKCYHHGNINERHRGVDQVLRGEKKDLKKEVDRYAAKRYKKHPKRFLKWIYSQRGRNSNEIADGVFGEWKKTIGFPDREHVAKRISKLKDPQSREYLTKLLEKGFPDNR